MGVWKRVGGKLQRGRETTRAETHREARAEESARARNAVGQRPGARVLTSQRCVHVEEVSSHVEPACARKVLLLAAEAERGEQHPCARLTGDKSMASCSACLAQRVRARIAASIPLGAAASHEMQNGRTTLVFLQANLTW